MKSIVASSLLIASQAIGITAAPRNPQEPYLKSCHGPPAFFLAGDSTTAVQSTGGGGWGNGFLTTLHEGAFGINYGHNGATTVSFRNGGDWARVLESVNRSLTFGNATSKPYTPFVTIQFGHNDQKPAANISTERYSANLKQMALDVWNAGGNPIFVTPLTRRNFNSSGLATESLAVEANATIAVAKSIGAYYIDLNRASTDYVDAIGANNSHTYNLIPTDNTHLNAAGSVLFGNLVSLLIDKSLRRTSELSITKYTYPNATIAKAITAGEYLYPSDFGTLVQSTAPEGF